MKFDPAKQSAHAEIAKLAALYAPTMTDDERAAHEAAQAAATAKLEALRGVHARYRDLLEFALAHGINGTPKYQREAVKSLRRALRILESQPGMVRVSETDADGRTASYDMPADEYAALRAFE